MNSPSSILDLPSSFNPLAGIGPDLEHDRVGEAFTRPSSFAPDVLLGAGRDISQHHYDLALAEIDRLQARIDELKMEATHQ